MSNNLLQRQIKAKIYDLYTADTSGFKTAITGMYYVKVPGGITQTSYPLVLYSTITTSSEYDFCRGATPCGESVLIEFKILSNSTVSTEAEDILDKLQGVYDGASLSLAGWGLREMRRESRNSITGPYIDEFEIWHLNALYRVICDRT
jgi:hypothetical protein